MPARSEGAAIDSKEHSGIAKALSVGGIFAALGAASCCVIPFTLFTLGVSGAWIGDLTALAPYQPVFIAAALACLGGGFVLLRRRSQSGCVDDAYCARPASDRIARIGLWTAAVLVIVAVLLPHLAPLFTAS